MTAYTYRSFADQAQQSTSQIMSRIEYLIAGDNVTVFDWRFISMKESDFSGVR